MKPLGKSFSSIVLDNTISKFPGIKVQEQINDQPRRVTEFHYCNSKPKTRNKPYIAGLS